LIADRLFPRAWLILEHSDISSLGHHKTDKLADGSFPGAWFTVIGDDKLSQPFDHLVFPRQEKQRLVVTGLDVLWAAVWRWVAACKRPAPESARGRSRSSVCQNLHGPVTIRALIRHVLASDSGRHRGPTQVLVLATDEQHPSSGEMGIRKRELSDPFAGSSKDSVAERRDDYRNSRFPRSCRGALLSTT